jgi:hypothetical protein
MPFESKAQQRYFFSNADKPDSGITKATAKEWASKTDFSKLPEKKKKVCPGCKKEKCTCDDNKKSAQVKADFLDAYIKLKSL